MTFDHPGRTVLFMAPPSDDDAQPEPPAPRASDEVMSRLRNPFQATGADTIARSAPR